MARETYDGAKRARPTNGDRSVQTRRLNTDPITAEPGAHPVAVGAAASGGAALGGALGGPVGPAIDGMAGTTVAEFINPSEEDAYWRDTYLSRPYADETLGYDHYRPAYRYGWESRTRFADRRWDQVERELEGGWRENRGTSRLGWSDAKLAARDAWQRVDRRILDEREIQRLRGAHDELNGVA